MPFVRSKVHSARQSQKTNIAARAVQEHWNYDVNKKRFWLPQANIRTIKDNAGGTVYLNGTAGFQVKILMKLKC